jgi:hypothetical protein
MRVCTYVYMRMYFSYIFFKKQKQTGRAHERGKVIVACMDGSYHWRDWDGQC